MIDMHSHIIYDVDDGSKSLEQSIEMIKLASEHGVEGIFSTSHYIEGMYTPASVIKERIEVLRKHLKEKNIAVDLFVGHELYIDNKALEALYAGKVLSLNESRYVLIEFPMSSGIYNIHDIIFEMTIKGYKPIIAHPERYHYIQENIDKVMDWIELGAYCQLNLPSLLGKYGEAVKKTALKLLKKQMYHFVGSDMHRPMTKYAVDKALKILKKKTNKTTFDKMTKLNGLCVVEDKDIEAFEIKKSLFIR